MRIETPRLIIREMRIDDAEAFNLYRDHEAYAAYTTAAPDPNYDTAGKIKERLARASHFPKRLWPLSVILKETNQVIGDVRLYNLDEKALTVFEMAYGLNPEFWGSGYITEAAQAVLDYAHDTLKLHRVMIRADARNMASWRIAEKIGMQYEGTTRYEIKTWRGFIPELKMYASVRPDLISK
jgi:[ribosomal protein S5]-alanine N-acetyltransferase